MYETLKRILVDDLYLRVEDLTPAAGCVEVGLDSLTAAELSSVLSDRLGIEIHDYELLELATVGDVAHLMEQRRPAETAARPTAVN
jgi:acyl carrier protein